MIHALPASRRASLREQKGEDPEFQIAPMIDILLVLLVFFMSIASTETLQANEQVRVPTATEGTGHFDPKGQAIVNVLWSELNAQGAIEIDGKTYAQPPEVIPMLRQKLLATPSMRILVRADKAARYDYMKQLLKAIGTAGGTNVTFSVVDQAPAIVK